MNRRQFHHTAIAATLAPLAFGSPATSETTASEPEIDTYELLPPPPMICPSTAIWTGEMMEREPKDTAPKMIRLLLTATEFEIELERWSDLKWVGHVNTDWWCGNAGEALITADKSEWPRPVVTVCLREWMWNGVIDAHGCWQPMQIFREAKFSEIAIRSWPKMGELRAKFDPFVIPNAAWFLWSQKDRLKKVDYDPAKHGGIL